MNTITPFNEVALPPGADPTWVDEWALHDDGIAYRLVWSRPMPGWSKPVPGFSDEDVRIVVTQFADGSIGTSGDDAPVVYCGQADHTPSSARLLAQSLVTAADLADEWTSTGPTLAERLAVARAALLAAYHAAATMPGNAGDYLRAALDSIADAEAVQR